MRDLPGTDRPARSRPRRLAFAATALLAGCASAGREAALVASFARSSLPGRTTGVLMRVSAPGDAPVAGTLRLWQLDGGAARGQPLRAVCLPAGCPRGAGGPMAGIAPSLAARGAGWLIEPEMSPGRYFMRLEVAGAAAPADATFRIPSRTSAVTYVGSFRLACDAPAQPCSLAAADETAAAAALVAAEGGGLAPPAAALARAYPPSIAALGLAPPGAPAIRLDTAAWAAAVDWSTFTSASQVPAAAPPPARAPRSEAPGWPGARMVSTSSAAEGLGLIVALPVYAAVLLVMLGVDGTSRVIARDQRNRQEAEQARRDAEALRARSLAQEQWGPCAAGIGAALAPDSVERHLRAALPPARAGGLWQATVTRVVFRHCGATPDSHGVEVATRWTAMRPGASEPAYDAAFSRTVAGATPDTRLAHPTRPPWELQVATEAACRPLAEYCGAGGATLLLQDVTRAVTEARDAIAAAR